MVAVIIGIVIVLTSVPVLILTGALDHTTPPRYGDMAVRTLTRGHHVVLASRSHNDFDPCVTGLIEAFMISGSVEKLDTGCAGVIDAPSSARFQIAQ